MSKNIIIGESGNATTLTLGGTNTSTTTLKGTTVEVTGALTVTGVHTNTGGITGSGSILTTSSVSGLSVISPSYNASADTTDVGIATSQTSGVLNIGTDTRTTGGSGGAINIGTGASSTNSINIGGGLSSSGTINIGHVGATGTTTTNINTGTTGSHPVNIGSNSSATIVNGALTVNGTHTNSGGISGTGNITTTGTGKLGIGITPTAPLHIYESSGTNITSTTGSIILEHGNPGGTSSILFKSNTNTVGGDYGYIYYKDDINSSTTNERSALYIGVENDIGVGGSGVADALILNTNGCYVGIGKTPTTTLDVSGNITTTGSGTITSAGLLTASGGIISSAYGAVDSATSVSLGANLVTGDVNIGAIQTDGDINIGQNSGRLTTGAINIASASTNAVPITIGSASSTVSIGNTLGVNGLLTATSGISMGSNQTIFQTSGQQLRLGYTNTQTSGSSTSSFGPFIKSFGPDTVTGLTYDIILTGTNGIFTPTGVDGMGGILTIRIKNITSLNLGATFIYSVNKCVGITGFASLGTAIAINARGWSSTPTISEGANDSIRITFSTVGDWTGSIVSWIFMGAI